MLLLMLMLMFMLCCVVLLRLFCLHLPVHRSSPPPPHSTLPQTHPRTRRHRLLSPPHRSASRVVPTCRCCRAGTREEGACCVQHMALWHSWLVRGDADVSACERLCRMDIHSCTLPRSKNHTPHIFSPCYKIYSHHVPPVMTRIRMSWKIVSANMCMLRDVSCVMRS